jgi:hypothetical protein
MKHKQPRTFPDTSAQLAQRAGAEPRIHRAGRDEPIWKEARGATGVVISFAVVDSDRAINGGDNCTIYKGGVQAPNKRFWRQVVFTVCANGCVGVNRHLISGKVL